MRKLSEIKGEDALDILAEIVEPFGLIATDENFVAAIRFGNKLDAVKIGLKDHKKEVLKVLALLEGEDPETYAPSIVRIPALVLELLNDPDLTSLFSSQDTVTSSGSATENTEETEKE